MNVSVKELSDSVFFLEKTSTLLTTEAQRISHHLGNLKSDPSNQLSYLEISDAVSTVEDLANWVEEIQSQVEKVRRELINVLYGGKLNV